MKILLQLFLISIILSSCKHKNELIQFNKYDEKIEIEEQQAHSIDRMKFKTIQSKYLDLNEVFKPFKKELSNFSESDYLNLAPYILEKDIPTIQEAVKNRILSYEKIALFYLYRIRKFESNREQYLNAIISLNPNILNEARACDRNRSIDVKYTLYGLPILLKDNINTENMRTTAGAFALKENKKTNDAFIVKKLKENGALILGKANLSEWAYYFCSGCPLGYSAIGGQTLNPYGRKVFETGGSSSGSGVCVAVNYAIAAVGTETSGSILSPSSKNAVVGLKPTIGLLSRTGIVPISSTLDTPGPMTKSVIDNAIFLSAMVGEDKNDKATLRTIESKNYLADLTKASLRGKKLGVMKTLLSDSIYLRAINTLKLRGAEIIEFEPEEINLDGFKTLLNIDMKNDLPKYLAENADKNIQLKSINDVIAVNVQDSINRMPYNQELFDGIVSDSTSIEELEIIKNNLEENGRQFLQKPLDKYNLDAILSINNYHASFAAVAKYPCLTVPMGFKKSGEPISLTFIAEPFKEKELLELGYAFEKISKVRKLPKGYN